MTEAFAAKTPMLPVAVAASRQPLSVAFQLGAAASNLPATSWPPSSQPLPRLDNAAFHDPPGPRECRYVGKGISLDREEVRERSSRYAAELLLDTE